MKQNANTPFLKRWEDAKQEALKQQNHQELVQNGFLKVADGVTFPGVNITEVNSALRNREETKP